MSDNEILTLFKTNRINKGIKAVYSFYPAIKKIILTNSGTKEDAEDIFQESIITLIGKLEKSDFQLTSGLNTYFYSIARNLWLKELRVRKKAIPEDWNESDAHNNSAPNSELSRSLAINALKQLGERCQKLLVLFYYKQLSFTQIAKMLEFSNDKVAKNQKYRCLEKAKSNYISLNSQ